MNSAILSTVDQTSIFFNRKNRYSDRGLFPFIARVTKRYSDKCVCDIETTDGMLLTNIPVMTRGGLVAGKVYGEIDLPEVDDWVVVSYASAGDSYKVIVGTILPYLVTAFVGDAVNSSGKAFTKKLLEAGKENHYKKIFKSGTTIEVEDDGTITIETPSGTYFVLDEASGGAKIEDSLGNVVSMQSGKVVINGNLEVLQ